MAKQEGAFEGFIRGGSMDNTPDKRMARVETLLERLLDKENLAANRKAEEITIYEENDD